MEDKLRDATDFMAAIERFTEAIQLNRSNYQLWSQRSAALARVGKYQEALEDAKRCHELKPDWPKSHHRLGVAYQGLGSYEDALISYAEGLAADPKLMPALSGLADCMLQSPFRGNFRAKYEKFESLKLDKNSFIITAVVGQELLNAGRTMSAMKILECARTIGTESQKLEASLLQALGKVHWALNDTDKALAYMEEDLKINESLGDNYGSVMAHDNLGLAYSVVGRHEDAIRHHDLQLQMAHAQGDCKEMIIGYNRLGAAFCQLGLYPHALRAYKDALKMAKDLSDLTLVQQATVNLAQTHIESGDLDKAMQWYHQELQQAKDIRNKADAYCHLGHVCHLKGNYDQSMMYYQQLLSVAVQMDDMALKAQAYGGMGQANRALGNLWPAQSCRDQQLKLCQDIGDEDGQLVALIHLGHVHRAAGKLSLALQHYNRALALAQKMQDKGGEAKAYSSLGSCHILLGNLREAISFYHQELIIVEESGDKVSETLALGSLGMAQLSLESFDTAHEHLAKSLQLAEEIGDKHILCLSLSNLGSYMTVVKQFAEAPEHLTNALKLAQELKNYSMESKICHNLALCHEGLGNYQQAIQYFQHDFMVARETQDKERMTLACEKLVKANKEIGDKEQAEVYQKKLTSIAEDSQKASGKCSFWNQLAEEAMESGEYPRAIEYYESLLKEAKNQQHCSFEGVAFRGLGNSHIAVGNYEHALSYYQRDLAVRKAASDLPGECDAYTNMGSAHNSLNQHSQALECFEQQLRLAKQLDNPVMTIKAYSCIGIVHRNMGNFKEALYYHQLQVNTAFKLKDMLEQAGACGNLGDTYEIVGNYAEAVKMQEQQLTFAKKAKSTHYQMRALASLGRAQRGLGAIRKALQYFEQRLKLAKELGDYYIEAECYADIGEIHLLLRDYMLASKAFAKQQEISRQLEDVLSEALAASGLGEVQFRLGNYREAIEHHMYDLQLSTQNELLDGEIRALGNVAEVYEVMKDFKNAIMYREKQISVADTIREDRFIHAMAFTGLGKIYLRVGDFHQAVSLLKQALDMLTNPYRQDAMIADADVEAEAKVRFYLGQAFYHNGQNDHALSCLKKSLPLFEHLRETLGLYDHATKQTLELLPILYQTLVCVLVRLGKVEDALEMAEREKNRTLVETLLERDVNKQTMRGCGLMKPFAPQSSWIQEAINHLKCPVIYYSVALRHIFIWLLHPKTGIIQFQTVDLSDLGSSTMSDTSSIFSENSSTYLQPLADSITAVRESLGVEPRRHSAKSMGSPTSDESGEDTESIHSADQFLSPNRANRGKSSKGVNLQVVHELYDLLIRPIESGFAAPPPGGPGHRGQVLIIPDKELYLLPFPLLKSEGSSVYFFQQFHLRFSPSLQALVADKTRSPSSSRKTSAPMTTSTQLPTPKKYSGRPKSPSLPSTEAPYRKPQSSANGINSTSPVHLVVGNPSIPISASQCNWQPMIGAEKEVKQVAEKLEVPPLLGSSASKDVVLKQISEAESVFLSVNVSWSHSHFVLASTDGPGSTDQSEPTSISLIPHRGNADGAATSTRRGVADGSAVGAMPEPSKYLLSLCDIMDAKLQAKLVVISGSHRSESPHLSAGSLLCMADAILAAGAHAVVIPQWPTTHQGSRLMMNAFYSSLLYGSKTSRALSYAMQISHQNTKYGHPSNWAGYMLLGRDVVIKDRSLDLAKSFRAMLSSPLDYLIAALRALNATIVASLKHLSQEYPEAKVTNRTTVENMVSSVHGWEDLLSANGFHFIGQVKKDVPATIVFPEHDDSGLQRRTHKHIEALLGIPPNCLKALGALSKHPEAGWPLYTALQGAAATLSSPSPRKLGYMVSIQVEQRVWDLPECSKFFQSLQFMPKANSGSQLVTLEASVARLDRKVVHLASIALLAVFGPEKHMKEPHQVKTVIESELL